MTSATPTFGRVQKYAFALYKIIFITVMLKTVHLTLSMGFKCASAYSVVLALYPLFYYQTPIDRLINKMRSGFLTKKYDNVKATIQLSINQVMY